VASSDETKWELTNQEAGWRIFQTRSQFRGVGSTPPHISFQMRGAKGVGIVLTQPEQVFQRLMDVGDNRLEWDTTFDRCLVPERVDKFTDIVELAQKEKVLFRRINSDDCNLFRRTARFSDNYGIGYST